MAEIKGKIRQLLDEQLQERGQEGFIALMVDEFYAIAFKVMDMEDRLIMGRGMRF